MVRTYCRVVFTCLGVMLIVGSAAAQTPAAAPRGDLRHQIYVMEGALTRAVLFGAQQVNREIRNASPDFFSIAGDAQARGVYLEGYGVFFDVGVPILRQSVMWSFRQFQQDDKTLRTAISALKDQLSTIRDQAKRHDVEIAISRLELQLAPAAAPAAVAAPPSGAAETLAPGAQPTANAVQTRTELGTLQDPNRAYTESVQRALVDAMIDYSAPMLLGADEWLTVAARDNEPRDSFAPQDPSEQVVTILLRIKGADLAAYRAGKIDRDEAKKRVQVKEF
ncbi:MAG TPA: hypothetical protein VEK56_18115 [Vicinamibacterales bacterium]|nr:hypothetical protein [Vicinamibacterales bacterium]